MAKQKWGGQDSGLADLQEVDTASCGEEWVTVQGPVKDPPMDSMSHGGGGLSWEPPFVVASMAGAVVSPPPSGPVQRCWGLVLLVNGPPFG